MASSYPSPDANGKPGTRRASASYMSFGDSGGGGSSYKPIGEASGDGGGAATRPWAELVSLHRFSKPESFADAIARCKANLSYFRRNYVMAMLVLLALSLLWRPVSLLVLVFLVVAWIYLYFSRSGDLVVFNRSVSEHVVFVFLTILTIVVIAFTPSAATPLLVSVLVGLAIVVLHACFFKPDDHFDSEHRSALLSSGSRV